jgi:predicted permease
MRRWHTRWSRVVDLVRSSKLERDIDDELCFHLDEEVEAGIRRGVPPELAWKAARESLGDTPLRVREEIRDVRQASRIDDLRRDVRHAGRLLRRNPVFATIVVCTLAVAIGAAVTVFSITDAWLFRPLPFPNADRLTVAFAATTARPSEPAVWMPYRVYLAFKDSARTFSSLAGAAFQEATWWTPSGAKSIVGMRITPEFFSTFGVPPLRGRTLGVADLGGTAAVVISYGFWQRELGAAEDVLGSTVTLGDIPHTVVGIMPASFDVRLLDQGEGAAFWTLLRTGERGYEPGGIGPLAIVGRLTDGVTIDAAQAEMVAIMRRSESAYESDFAKSFVASVTSLQADNTRTVRATLMTVLAATLCLLVIASMNVGTLLLGRGIARRGEVALRCALGAGRGRLVRQFLAESLVLSAFGGACALGLALIGTRLFLAWNPLGTLPTNQVQLDERVLAAAILAMTITTIVAGLVPALRLSSAAPAAAIGAGEGGRTTAPAKRAQSAMLVAQIAVSTVLLVCAALLAKTFIQLRTEPLGFTPDDVTVATVVLPIMPFASGTERFEFYRRLEERILARPGVRGVAAVTAPPLVAGVPMAVNVTAVDEPAASRISTQDVTSGFFGTLEIPIVAGRAFTIRDDNARLPVAILNARAAADLFGNPRRAIGQRIRLERETWREIVGVVGNVRTTFFNTLEWRTEPMVYRPAAQSFSRLAPMAASFSMWVHVRAEQPLSAIDVRDAALSAGQRAAVIEVRRVRDLVADATKQPTFRMTLLLWFCGVSLLLAAIGVYGLVMQAVAERVREIAIRIALGANPREVTSAFVGRALATGAAGLAIGVLLAVMLAHTLESLLYGVRAVDAASLALSGVLLLGVTGLAAVVPALRATRVDAVNVLRA